MGTASQTVETGRIKTANSTPNMWDALAALSQRRVRDIWLAMEAADTPYKQAVAARITIGRTLDTSDDMARLMLVTHYAGTKMVRVYAA